MVYGAEAVMPHDLRFDAPRVVVGDIPLGGILDMVKSG